MNTEESIAYAQDRCRCGDCEEAQKVLNKIEERNARWHFAQSEVYFRKNWYNECRKELETAMEMDPENEEYKAVYKKLIDGKRKKKAFPPKKQQMGQKRKKCANWEDVCNVCGEPCIEGGCICCCEGICQGICDGC